MLRRASRSASSSLWSGDVSRPIVVFPIALGFLTLGAIFYSRHTIVTEKELLSRITDDTPISRFYGPGSWWAWLITLGMTHGRMGIGLLMMSEISEEWDYDLLGASGYIVAASIDVILKSRAIAQLGAAANESALVPALLCAERVVSLGTGSSLFTVVTTILVRGGRSRAVIAVVPLIFAITASWFTLRAHQAISHAAPVLWCGLHDGTAAKRWSISFTSVDFPASLLDLITVLPEVYMSRDYWIRAALVGAALTALVRAEGNVMSFSILVPGLALFPTILLGCLFVIEVLQWLGLWVVFWGPIHILAFFPQMGYFPLTKMSVMDVDQLAALLGIGFIAIIRSGRRALKALRNRVNPS
ncbi:hypothetical protein MSAN_01198900 [Mycena sanguinolenta]|uniref:Uncharacterized protein n=1 Tax=Mycena sanguinolenta TaxID=230812 RepID=A0A8H7D4M0_9AGAR|nr:hypothetical protein MSAN_01198900 [Mycena sanguinolenta]